jgi:hypothetical protein
MKKTKLISKYEQAVTEIVKQFIVKNCEVSYKESIDYIEYWVGDKVGGYVQIADRCILFGDILHDIKTEQPKGKLFEWYDYCVENQNEPNRSSINYESYCMGFKEILTEKKIYA